MVTQVATREYTHQELGKDYGGIAGYYTPRKEVRLGFQGREVLYIVGHAVIESSCCGTGNWDYVLVPGYVTQWHNRKNNAGLAISTVEPVEAETQKDLTRIIETRENTNCISFW